MARDLIVAETRSSPQIHLRWETAEMSIEGQSYPENAARFYQPVFDWLTSRLATLDKTMVLSLKLGYLNTGSTKMVLMLLDMLQEAHETGHKVRVEWHYDEENEDALGVGEELSEDLDLPFDLIEDR